MSSEIQFQGESATDRHWGGQTAAYRLFAQAFASLQRYPRVARFHAQLARALWRRDDLGEARNQFQIAADLGSALGFDGLAEFYMWGRGVEADREKAFALWVEAAERGYAPAEQKLLTARKKYGGDKFLKILHNSAFQPPCFEDAKRHTKGTRIEFKPLTVMK